jgi:hypothetical protein
VATELRVASRRGAALLVALSLIILGAALLAGTMAAARMVSRASQSYVNSALAESRWRTDVATFVTGWDSSLTALVPGAQVARTIGPSSVGISGEVAKTRIRLLRLDSLHYLLSGATQVGPDAAVRAQRRASLLLELIPSADSINLPMMPIIIRQWARHPIY